MKNIFPAQHYFQDDACKMLEKIATAISNNWRCLYPCFTKAVQGLGSLGPNLKPVLNFLIHIEPALGQEKWCRMAPTLFSSGPELKTTYIRSGIMIMCFFLNITAVHSNHGKQHKWIGPVMSGYQCRLEKP